MLVAALVLAACSGNGESTGRADGAMSTVEFETAAGSTQLAVRLATTPEERAQGLMGIEDLPADQGMAFVFDEPTTARFWMKDTLIPLSIAFVDEDGRVIAIRDMEPCAADPCPMYGAAGPYVMAVEANAGWFEEAGVDVGSRVELGGDPLYG
jgi:uncharacterized membrane protein (UPF0127 family)